MINIDLYGAMVVSRGYDSCEIKIDNIKENLIVYTKSGPIFIDIEDLILKLKDKNVGYL